MYESTEVWCLIHHTVYGICLTRHGRFGKRVADLKEWANIAFSQAYAYSFDRSIDHLSILFTRMEISHPGIILVQYEYSRVQ